MRKSYGYGRRSKFRNVATAGYDSKKESKRAEELFLMQRAGQIQDLQTQVKFVLIPAQREEPTRGPRGGLKPGKLIEHECAYIADFVYTKDGKQIVEDSKGMRTKDYIIKRKLMLWVHGIRVYET